MTSDISRVVECIRGFY